MIFKKLVLASSVQFRRVALSSVKLAVRKLLEKVSVIHDKIQRRSRHFSLQTNIKAATADRPFPSLSRRVMGNDISWISGIYKDSSVVSLCNR